MKNNDFIVRYKNRECNVRLYRLVLFAFLLALFAAALLSTFFAFFTLFLFFTPGSQATANHSSTPPGLNFFQVKFLNLKHSYLLKYWIDLINFYAKMLLRFWSFNRTTNWPKLFTRKRENKEKLRTCNLTELCSSRIRRSSSSRFFCLIIRSSITTRS